MELESLKSGKRQLLDEVARAYDEVAGNVAEELHRLNVGTTRIALDDLKELQERAARAGELEKENQRLAEELKTVLQKRLPAAVSSSPAFNQIDENDPELTTKEKYRALVKQHNAICEQWKGQKEAKEGLEAKWRKLRQQATDWKDRFETLEAKHAKKQFRIKELVAEVKDLTTQLQIARGGDVPTVSVTHNEPPCPSPISSEPPGRLLAPFAAPVQDYAGILDARRTKGSPLSSTPILEDNSFNPAQFSSNDQLSEEESVELQLPKLRQDVIVHSEGDLSDEPDILAQYTSSTTDEEHISKKQAELPEEITSKHPFVDDNESPVVVSVRRVGKRKSRHDDDQHSVVTKIKFEILSSSPIGLARLGHLNPNESIDLDEIGEKTTTPKKTRRYLDQLLGRRAISNDIEPIDNSYIDYPEHSHPRAASEQITQETPVQRVRGGTIASALQPSNANKQILPRTSDGRSEKRRRRIPSDEAVGDVMEDGDRTPIRTSKSKNSAKDSGRLGDLLAKPSPKRPMLNASVLHVTPAVQRRSPVKPALTVHHDTAHLFSNVSESTTRTPANPIDTPRTGLICPPTTSRPTPRGSSERKGISKGLLSASDSGSTPSSRDAMSRLTHTPKGSATPTDAHSSRPVSRASVTSRNTRPGSSKDSSRPTTASSHRKRPSRTDQTLSEWEMDPEQEPLRSRPFDSLKPDDFKINPAYNQGYDFAYGDVVRNKDERRCLQGCVKPGCCGEKYRALAISMRPFGKELTLSQEEADDLVLQDFLGDNAYKLRNITKREREDLLIQAKTRELANKHGTHRNAYERPLSPPGFWRADFPTTQEEAQDRAKAKEFEKALIKQRYDEAMRSGGAFLFRDE